jgi:hypothetical protein
MSTRSGNFISGLLLLVLAAANVTLRRGIAGLRRIR